jgi:hypothetical protein
MFFCCREIIIYFPTLPSNSLENFGLFQSFDYLCMWNNPKTIDMKETTRNFHRRKRAAGNRQRPIVTVLLRLVFICCGGCSAEPTVAPVCAKTGWRFVMP